MPVLYNYMSQTNDFNNIINCYNLQIIMTDSFKIPDLHLFGSRRRTYETVRNIDCNFRDQSLLRRPIFVPAHHQYECDRICHIPVAEPIPVPVPIPMHPPPLAYQPLPVCYDLPLRTSDYIPAPSTYLQYAEQYLRGRPIPILPPAQTARFMGSRKMQTSRRNINIQPNLNLSKNVYFDQKREPSKQQPKIVIHHANRNNKTPQNKKKEPSPPKNNVKKNQQNNQIRKDPYIFINTQRQINREVHIKQQIHHHHQNNTLIQQSHVIHDHTKNKKKEIQEGVQTQNTGSGNKNPQKPPPPPPQPQLPPQQPQQAQQHHSQRQTIIQQRHSSSLDAQKSQRFRRYIQNKFQQIYNIRINFNQNDIGPLNVYADMQQLSQTKEQYMNQSRNLLVRLNELAADKVQIGLIYKLLQKTKQGIIWPDV